MIYRTLPLLLCLLLAGCDLFGDDPDTTIRATGTVVFAETGEPIGGLGVVFRLAGGVGASIVVRARTTTAADGSFELIHDGGEGASYTLVINDDPYDERYSTSGAEMFAGEEKDFGVVELEARP
jgi:hypothetical protein